MALLSAVCSYFPNTALPVQINSISDPVAASIRLPFLLPENDSWFRWDYSFVIFQIILTRRSVQWEVRCLYARIHRGLTSGHTAIVIQIVEEADLE